MIPTVTLTIDDTQLRRNCSGVASRLETGMPETMEQIGKYLAGRNKVAFENKNRGGMNKPLKKSTVRRRKQISRKTGRPTVAGDKAPLRAFEDRLYKAATAASASVDGAIFEFDGNSVTVGIDPNEIVFARMATGIHPKAKARGIAQRVPTTLEVEDPPQVRKLAKTGLSLLLRKSQGG